MHVRLESLTPGARIRGVPPIMRSVRPAPALHRSGGRFSTAQLVTARRTVSDRLLGRRPVALNHRFRPIVGRVGGVPEADEQIEK